jgi:hypothetical protein
VLNRTEKMLATQNLTQNFSKNKILKTEDNASAVKKRKKYEEKSLKKGFGSGVGSGSFSQRYGRSTPKCHGSPTLIFKS